MYLSRAISLAVTRLTNVSITGTKASWSVQQRAGLSQSLLLLGTWHSAVLQTLFICLTCNFNFFTPTLKKNVVTLTAMNRSLLSLALPAWTLAPPQSHTQAVSSRTPTKATSCACKLVLYGSPWHPPVSSPPWGKSVGLQGSPALLGGCDARGLGSGGCAGKPVGPGSLPLPVGTAVVLLETSVHTKAPEQTPRVCFVCQLVWVSLPGTQLYSQERPGSEHTCESCSVPPELPSRLLIRPGSPARKALPQAPAVNHWTEHEDEGEQGEQKPSLKEGPAGEQKQACTWEMGRQRQAPVLTSSSWGRSSDHGDSKPVLQPEETGRVSGHQWEEIPERREPEKVSLELSGHLELSMGGEAASSPVKRERTTLRLGLLLETEFEVWDQPN